MIALDYGHGVDTPGKRSGDLHEWKFNRDVGKWLETELGSRGIPYDVLVPEDEDIGLRTRVERAKESEANLLLSIHGNAFKDEKVHGLETFYYSQKGKRFAEMIQRELVAELGWKDRGVKKGNFYIIKKTPQVAALVELGFYTNPKQRAEMLKPEVQKRMAKALANAIQQYLERD